MIYHLLRWTLIGVGVLGWAMMLAPVIYGLALLLSQSISPMGNG